MDGKTKSPFVPVFLCCARLFLVAGVAPTWYGCGRSISLPYANFAQGAAPESNAPAKENAFGDYLAAAHELELKLKGHENLFHKSSFTPNEQTIIEDASADPLKEIKAGLQKRCQIPYAPPGSKEATEGRSAMHLLSKVLVWRVQKDCEAESYESAIQTAVLASKFGFDLADGLPNDASLGLLTVDAARQAIAPSLNEMSTVQLELLAKTMKTVFLNRPNMDACYQNIQKDSLVEVQNIQDAYRYERYDQLSARLGSAAREIIPTLKELHRQPEERRAAFFDGFAQQARDEADLVKQQSSLPVSERIAPPAPAPNAERPWKKIARRVLGIGKPLLAMSDATEARTELLVLEAEIIRSRKAVGKTPDDLSQFSIKLSTDPYSGQPFIYRTDGSNYKLYSVGEDLIDNDGDTDETFSTPDLKLERGPH
jgi:hypothetical protein